MGKLRTCGPLIYENASYSAILLATSIYGTVMLLVCPYFPCKNTVNLKQEFIQYCCLCYGVVQYDGNSGREWARNKDIKNRFATRDVLNHGTGATGYGYITARVCRNFPRLKKGVHMPVVQYCCLCFGEPSSRPHLLDPSLLRGLLLPNPH